MAQEPGNQLVPYGYDFADIPAQVGHNPHQAHIPVRDHWGYIPNVHQAPRDPIRPQPIDPYAQEQRMFEAELGGLRGALQPAAESFRGSLAQIFESLSGIPLVDPREDPLPWLLAFGPTAYDYASRGVDYLQNWAVRENALALARSHANNFVTAAAYAQAYGPSGKCPILSKSILLPVMRLRRSNSSIPWNPKAVVRDL